MPLDKSFDELNRSIRKRNQERRDEVESRSDRRQSDEEFARAWDDMVAQVTSTARTEQDLSDAIGMCEERLLTLGRMLVQRFHDFWLDEILKDAIGSGADDLMQYAIRLLLAACDAKGKGKIARRLREIYDFGHLSNFPYYFDDVREVLRVKEKTETVPRTPEIRGGVAELVRILDGMPSCSAKTIRRNIGVGRWDRDKNRFRSHNSCEQRQILKRVREYFRQQSCEVDT